MLGNRRWRRHFKGQTGKSLRRTRKRFRGRKRTGSWSGDHKKFRRSSRRAGKRRKQAGNGIKVSFHLAYESRARAIDHARFRSRSADVVIRVYDEAGNVIETHEHKGEFKEW